MRDMLAAAAAASTPAVTAGAAAATVAAAAAAATAAAAAAAAAAGGTASSGVAAAAQPVATAPAATGGDEWSDAAVGTLLDCYNDKFMELNGGSIGTKGWQDVIARLNSACADGKPVYSYRRCKNKLDVMKRRFKIERDRKANNGGVSDWPWFLKMEEIVSRNPRLGGAAPSSHGANVNHSNVVQESKVALTQPVVMDKVITNGVTTHYDHDHLHHALAASAAGAGEDSGQLLSEEEDEDDSRNSPAGSKSNKRRRRSGGGGGGGCLHNPVRHAKDVARIVTEALERMEVRRLDVMRELELKRNETQLQIARMLIEHNSRYRGPVPPDLQQQQHSFVDCHISHQPQQQLHHHQQQSHHQQQQPHHHQQQHHQQQQQHRM